MTEQVARERRIVLEGNHNARDIGGYLTEAGDETAWGKFVRSDGLHRLTEADQTKLVDYGVRTVIDLRHERELDEAPNPFAQRDDVNYVNVSFFEGALDPNRPAEELPTLLELYKMALERSQPTIKQVFETLGEAETYPVLVHCSAGKDRTGITSAFVLRLAGVPVETVAEDYGITAKYLEPWFETALANAKENGRDPEKFKEMLKSEPEWMVDLLAHVDENYGGVAPYLKSLGISDDQLNTIRNQMAA